MYKGSRVQDAGGNGPRPVRWWIIFSVFRKGSWNAARGGRLEPPPVRDRERAEISAAKAHRLFEHRVEHWGEIAGRGVDDAEHLGGRGLPLQCLVTLLGALVQAPAQLGKLALEIGVELFKMMKITLLSPYRTRRYP